MSPKSYTAMTFQSPFRCLNNILLEFPKEDLCPLAKMFTSSLTKHERREKGGNAGKTTQPQQLLPSSLALSLDTWGYLWPSLHPRLHCKRGSPNTDLSTDLVCFLNSSTLALLPGTSHHCLRHFGVASDGGAIREQSPTPCRLQC